MSIYKKENGNLEKLAGGVSVLKSTSLIYTFDLGTHFVQAADLVNNIDIPDWYRINIKCNFETAGIDNYVNLFLRINDTPCSNAHVCDIRNISGSSDLFKRTYDSETSLYLCDNYRGNRSYLEVEILRANNKWLVFKVFSSMVRGDDFYYFSNNSGQFLHDARNGKLNSIQFKSGNGTLVAAGEVEIHRKGD